MSVQNTASRNYTIIYRRGGTANFEWGKTLVCATKQGAESEAERTKTMGYKSIVLTFDELAAKGLPTEYDGYAESVVVVKKARQPHAFGVFNWNSTGTYKANSAVKTYAQKNAAETFASKNGYVVRALANCL